MADKLQILLGLLWVTIITLVLADEIRIEKEKTEEINHDTSRNIDQSPDSLTERHANLDGSPPVQGGQLINEETEEQGRQLYSDREESKKDIDIKNKKIDIKNKNIKEPAGDNEASDQNEKVADKTESENNQSYFSIGNILRSIVDPVLDEFGKEVKPGSTIKLENQTANFTLNQTEISVHLNSSQNDTKLRGIEIASTNKTEKKTKFQCQGRNNTNITNTERPKVKIVNNTVLLNMLNFDKNESSDCILVMFFAPWCHFCAQTAPGYNALARAFPQLDVVAVDAAQFSNLNARFGTVSVPNILLFHNSKAVVRFNQTDRGFENLVMFVKNITGLAPNTTFNVTEEDYNGPLPSIPSEDSDYLLWVAWVFVIICSSFMFVQSTYGQQWINRVKILWQEHQHID